MNQQPFPPPPPRKAPSTGLTVLLVLGLCALVVGGPLLTLAVVGVRRYLANAKSAEARATVVAIAKSYKSAAEGNPILNSVATRRAIVLRSLPAVPATVPAGSKYMSTTADWARWSAIKFEMSQPQYYQYEVQASPDGTEAEVIARGDLNGDGKTSQFSLHLQVSGDTVAVAPTIVETNPEE